MGVRCWPLGTSLSTITWRYSLLLALLFLLLNGAGMSNNSPVGFSANRATLLSRTALQSVRVPTVCWLHLQPHCPLLSSLAASQAQPLLAMTQTHGRATPSLPGLQRFSACYATTWSALHLAHSLPLLRSLFQKLSKTNYLLGGLLTSYNAVSSFRIARTLLDMLAWLWLCESNSVLSTMSEE